MDNFSRKLENIKKHWKESLALKSKIVEIKNAKESFNSRLDKPVREVGIQNIGQENIFRVMSMEEKVQTI